MSKNNSPRASVQATFAILTALLLAIAVDGTFLTIVSPVASAEDMTFASGPHIPPVPVTESDAAAHVRISDAYGKLPLSFEANRGQTDQRVKFLSRGSGHTLFLTSSEAVLVLTKRQAAEQGEPRAHDKVTRMPETRNHVTGTVLRMTFVGANPQARVVGREELSGQAHYFLGNDPAKWRTNVPTYAGVRYAEIYPGIDVVFYGTQRQLEYDVVVSPGADPARVVLGFHGAEKLDVDAQGDLAVHTAAGTIGLRKPVIYQEVDGIRREITGGYVLEGRRQVGFQVAAYDRSRPLVIDPVLIYSTYLGGSVTDQAFGIAVDSTGNAYVTGSTYSIDFPTSLTAFQTTAAGYSDAFVTKLNPTGSALVYSTYLGGYSSTSSYDFGRGIAVDATGNAYVTGETSSTNFPTTLGAFQTTFAGGSDAFVTKLNPTGSALVYSTYLGGSNADLAYSIAADATGNAYVTGSTYSTDFPTTLGAFQTTATGGLSFDAFVTKLSPMGSALVYSTYVGGSNDDQAYGIAVDATGNAYVTGQTSSTNFPTTLGAFQTTFAGGSDAFVTKLNPTGSALVYSTYLGGSSSAYSIAVDATGNAYVTGDTGSNFPTTLGAFQTTAAGLFDAFVTQISPTGSALVYSTYLGGSRNDLAFGIAVDATGNAYVTGVTESTDFPTTLGAFQTTAAGLDDAFVTKLSPTGAAVVYSTYLGGRWGDVGRSIAVDATGNAYVTGHTQSPDFPTTLGTFQTTAAGLYDAFVTKISDVARPATLTLAPGAATNPVDTQHCVTATVTDVSGNPTPGVTVRFTVAGAVNTTRSATTNVNGQATVCYTGPALPGADAITAYADTNSNNTQDAEEPSGAATKTWVLPVTTPLCTITNGGQITANNGDNATFGGNAKADATEQTSGQEEYQDKGPAQKMNVHAINVLAVVCQGTRRAAIYGQATINGSGSFFYRIRVQDLGEPGRGTDTYGILLENGYYSGERRLDGGNIQIHR